MINVSNSLDSGEEHEFPGVDPVADLCVEEVDQHHLSLFGITNLASPGPFLLQTSMSYRESSVSPTGAERGGNNLKGFKELDLNAKARIWP